MAGPFASRFSIGCCCGGSGAAPSHTCNACPVPDLLHCTWRYRSYNYPGGLPHCSPGAAVNSIAFDLAWSNAAGGWVSDYLAIGDHDWEFGCMPAGSTIPAGDWVRVAIYCVPGSGFRLYYLPTPARPAACFPGQSTGGCLTAGQFSTGVGITSCSPFMASGYDAQGPSYNEDADKYFERWDFTA